jgi:hypothetical protein
MSRSMVEQLENVDPGRLKHEEKLAFWINIYNALLMHVIMSQLRSMKFLNITILAHVLISYFFFIIVKIQAYLAYGIPRNNLKRMTLLQRVR